MKAIRFSFITNHQSINDIVMFNIAIIHRLYICMCYYWCWTCMWG